MKSLRHWFEKTFPEDDIRRPRAERRPVPGLEAIHWTGSSPGLDVVRNISATGMYLVTRERWQKGEINPIRLVYPELTDNDPDHQVTIETRAVRWGEDGMGLSFILPESMELWLWKSGEELVEPAEILSEFRIARGLAFLRRICPPATQELKLLFREGLSNLRADSAIAIAHRSEIMLAAEPGSDRLRAPESVVLPVVKNGSWAEDQSTRNLWAGILATSCTLMGDDETNVRYLELLSDLATIHGRLYILACEKSEKVITTSGEVYARPYMCTADEMIQVAGAHDLAKIDRNLLQLSILGLLVPRNKTKYFSFDQDANLTPTPLGLELYARCQGFRGAPRDYYAARAKAENSAATSERS